MGLAKFLGIDDESVKAYEKRKAEWIKKSNEKYGTRYDSYGPNGGSTMSTPTKIALINMLSTADLDQVIADCAPLLSSEIYKTGTKVDDIKSMMERAKEFDELRGKYDDLEKRYSELLAERDRLLGIIEKFEK